MSKGDPGTVQEPLPRPCAGPRGSGGRIHAVAWEPEPGEEIGACPDRGAEGTELQRPPDVPSRLRALQPWERCWGRDPALTTVVTERGESPHQGRPGVRGVPGAPLPSQSPKVRPTATLKGCASPNPRASAIPGPAPLNPPGLLV